MVNNKQIKVIFFDIGDVLLKIHPERMISKISNCANIPYEVVERAFPQNAHDAYERGKMTDYDWYMSCKTALPKNNSLSEDQFWESWSLLLGNETEVVDILINLKKNYKIWLLSNTNPMHIKNEIESKYVFQKLVDGGIYSYDVGYRKPEKEIYHIACDSAEVNPENSIFIDDLEENIIGANKVGIKGIHYKNTIELLKELKRINISYD